LALVGEAPDATLAEIQTRLSDNPIHRRKAEIAQY